MKVGGWTVQYDRSDAGQVWLFTARRGADRVIGRVWRQGDVLWVAESEEPGAPVGERAEGGVRYEAVRKLLEHHERVHEGADAVAPLDEVVRPDDGSGVGRGVICVDFDGTLHRYSKGWSDGSIYDPPIEGALWAIERLIAKGYTIVVSSARPDVEGITAWLKRHGFPAGIEVTNAKPVAMAYIDDRGVTYDGDWPAVLTELLLRFDKEVTV